MTISPSKGSASRTNVRKRAASPPRKPPHSTVVGPKRNVRSVKSDKPEKKRAAKTLPVKPSGRKVAPSDGSARIKHAKTQIEPEKLRKKRAVAASEAKDSTPAKARGSKAAVPPEVDTVKSGGIEKKPKRKLAETPSSPATKKAKSPRSVAEKPKRTLRSPHKREPEDEMPFIDDVDEPAIEEIEPTDAFLDDDLEMRDDEESLIGGELEIDPFEIPLDLLDSDMVEVPRPASHTRPRPPRPKAERRPQTCSSCGGTFTWVSVDGLCFTCLKRKLAARKREDESYTGFTGEADDDDDGS